MRDLILKNSEWYRGQGSTHSCLLRHDGRRCCLGIDAKVRGISDQDLHDEKYPSSLEPTTDEIQKYKKAWRDPISHVVGAINDDPNISDDTRIERLRPYFRSKGVNLFFDPEN